MSISEDKHLVTYPGKLAIQQRVLPAYRGPFFETLAEVCQGGLSVFAGKPLPIEGISTLDKLSVPHYFEANNRHFQSPGSVLYFCWQGSIKRWIEEWNPDALIVEANPRYISTRGAIQWMHARGRPVLGWGLGAPQPIETSFINRQLSLVQRYFRKQFVKVLDGLIAYSHRGASEYHAQGFLRERVFVAPNAVLPRPSFPPIKRPKRFEERPKIIFVGRIQARKRIDNLIRACAELPAELQPQLWIVGEGSARDEFQKVAEAVYPRTEFLGSKYGADLQPLFAAADLFVLPGTGGLAVQEAMASCLPVIVAQGDGTQEDLVRSENGWVVPPDDISALKSALLEALGDVNRLRRMGLESYRIVRDEVNLESMVEAFLNAVLFVNKDSPDQV